MVPHCVTVLMAQELHQTVSYATNTYIYDCSIVKNYEFALMHLILPTIIPFTQSQCCTGMTGLVCLHQLTPLQDFTAEGHTGILNIVGSLKDTIVIQTVVAHLV